MVLALVEADTITGVLSILLALQRAATTLWLTGQAAVPLHLEIARFDRRGRTPSCGDVVASAVAEAGAGFTTIDERFRFDPHLVKAVAMTMARLHPDIVETHSVKSHALARLAARAYPHSVPWLAYHHGYTWPDLRMRAYNQVDRWSLRGARHVIVPTRALRADVMSRGVAPSKIRVVPNAIELQDIQATAAARQNVRESLGCGPSEHLIVSIGRLSHEKGHRDLIEAVGRLQQRRPDLRVRLVIAGGGPLQDRLTALAHRIAEPGTVRLLGNVCPAHPLYAGADLAVLPSHSEGMPNSLVEAAAYGLPIVATSVGGVPEMTRNGESALLVPPRNPAALAGAMERLLNDRQMAATLGEHARATLAERARAGQRAHTLLSFYAELLESARAASVSSNTCWPATVRSVLRS